MNDRAADSVWGTSTVAAVAVAFVIVGGTAGLFIVGLALVGTTRTAIAALGLTLFGLLFAADIGLTFVLSRGILAEEPLVSSLAISPLSAYRGLVLETTVIATAGTGPRTASPPASALGLLVWWLGSLLVAAGAIRR
jgi:ABC-2 type transport system permease protein